LFIQLLNGWERLMSPSTNLTPGGKKAATSGGTN